MEKLQADGRIPFFDTLRGVAVLLMSIYHFSFDLNYFGIINEDMNHDPFWLTFRAVIMTSFTVLVGIGFYLGRANYCSKGFWSRTARIGACAGLVSFSTYFLFNETWVFFGTLHLILFATLLAPILIRAPIPVLLAGIGIATLPNYYRSFWYLHPVRIISGLSPLKPSTVDFAPLMPWLGVILIGVFLGYVIRRASLHSALPRAEVPLLTRLGQNSLLFYMTHQLALFPFAWVLSKF